MEITRYRKSKVVNLASSEGKRIVRGTAAVWYNGDAGTEYELDAGLFERLDRHAFDDALKSGDIFALYNHNPEQVLARTSNGRLRLWTDEQGLQYELTLNSASYANDLWTNLTESPPNIQGSSFRARMGKERGKDYTIERSGDKQILTWLKVESLVEVSPVFDPAYTGTDADAIKRSIAQSETEIRKARLKTMRLV